MFAALAKLSTGPLTRLGALGRFKFGPFWCPGCFFGFIAPMPLDALIFTPVLEFLPLSHVMLLTRLLMALRLLQMHRELVLGYMFVGHPVVRLVGQVLVELHSYRTAVPESWVLEV